MTAIADLEGGEAGAKHGTPERPGPRSGIAQSLT